MSGESAWSCRFCPTPGRSAIDIDSETAQLVCGADAGEQQELGRLDRPAADDHLALGPDLLDGAVVRELDAHAPPALEQRAAGRGRPSAP